MVRLHYAREHIYGLVIIRAHGRTFYMQDAFLRLGYADVRWWFADALEFT